jgi:hypothetical protein
MAGIVSLANCHQCRQGRSLLETLTGEERSTALSREILTTAVEVDA